MALHRSDLDKARCSAPGCTHEDHRMLFLHPRCHPEAPTVCAYDMVRGTLVVLCGECEAPAAEIAVAE